MLVNVLMSTYNGERYLREQLNSILNQTGVEVNILVRDDGSKDSTLSILDEYTVKDTRVKYYMGENLGPTYSFLDLLRHAPEGKYYAFSDQDDYWHEDKLKSALDMLQQLDLKKPALYFSNLEVVDEKLNFCRLSHTKSQFQPNKYSCLAEYMPTGCTMVFNRELVDLVNLKKPKWTTMHDIWLYLICMFFGSTIYDFKPHISYRIHGNNVIGAYKKKTFSVYWEHFKRMFDRSEQPKLNNAISFYECYGDMLNQEDKEKVLEIVNYKNSFKDWMKLLFDKDYTATDASREFRNRVLILMRIF